MTPKERREQTIKLAKSKPEVRRRIIAKMSWQDVLETDSDYERWVHDSQLEPNQDGWRVWLLLAGRGFGKTRAGAEWIHRIANSRPGVRIAGGAGGIARYIIRGTVVDESGAPIEGAAIALGAEMVFTDSRGEFLLRTRRPERYTVAVDLGEFLLPGTWEVVRAPDQVTAAPEARATRVHIVLRKTP